VRHNGEQRPISTKSRASGVDGYNNYAMLFHGIHHTTLDISIRRGEESEQ